MAVTFCPLGKHGRRETTVPAGGVESVGVMKGTTVDLGEQRLRGAVGAIGAGIPSDAAGGVVGAVAAGAGDEGAGGMGFGRLAMGAGSGVLSPVNGASQSASCSGSIARYAIPPTKRSRKIHSIGLPPPFFPRLHWNIGLVAVV